MNKKHFPSWFLQSRSLDDGRVSALSPALCPLKHMLEGSNTRSRTPTNSTNSLCLFFFFLPLLQIIYHKIQNHAQFFISTLFFIIFMLNDTDGRVKIRILVLLYRGRNNKIYWLVWRTVQRISNTITIWVLSGFLRTLLLNQWYLRWLFLIKDHMFCKF